MHLGAGTVWTMHIRSPVRNISHIGRSDNLLKVDILDIDKLIRVNHLAEISNPKILSSQLTFQSDGLLSNEIFGYSTVQRQTTFAYIDLHGHYIHPIVYKEICMKSMKIVPKIVSGQETVSVVNGKLTPDPDGWTGLENLYKHWDEITSFGSTPNSIGNKILKSFTKSDVFIDKYLVIPPFYHDADINARDRKVKVSELTSMYSKLISDVQFKLNNMTSFDIIGHASTQKIQEEIVSIYLYLESQLAKKQGYIRKRLLAKKTDYGIRSVATAPSFTGNNIDFQSIEYGKVYIPVSLLMSSAYPFIMRFIKEFFSDISNRVTFRPPTDDQWEIYQPDIQFDVEYIEKLINNYMKLPTTRFDPIKMDIQNLTTGEIKQVTMLEEKTDLTTHTTEQTPVTSLDICFRAAYDSCYDRYAKVTRYPVLSVYGIFFAQIDVISTNKTIPIQVQGKEYQKYPIIHIGMAKKDIPSQFINTIKFSLARLGGLEPYSLTSPLNNPELRETPNNSQLPPTSAMVSRHAA